MNDMSNAKYARAPIGTRGTGGFLGLAGCDFWAGGFRVELLDPVPCAEAGTEAAMAAAKTTTGISERMRLPGDAETEQRLERLHEAEAKIIVPAGGAQILRALPQDVLDGPGILDAAADDERRDSGDVRRGHGRALESTFDVAIESRRVCEGRRVR